MSLYNKLSYIKTTMQRENMIYSSYYKKMVRPAICNEETIKLLSEYMPTNLKELQNISGIGDAFVEKFGQSFIDEIVKYKEANKETLDYQANEKEIEILKKLENRLVNINQRNRMLYCGKLSRKQNIDVYKFKKYQQDILDMILKGSNRKLKIYEYKIDEDKKIIDESYYNNLLYLSRENNRTINETGNDELYIAYPFVEGTLEAKILNVKAPLILFPVKIEKDNGNFYILNDATRDKKYNDTLILANDKINQENKVLPVSEIEETEKASFIENMIDYYKSNGVSITADKIIFEKFLENSRDNFPKYASKELHLKGYMSLGIYRSNVGAVHRDFKAIIEDNKLNEILKGIIDADIGTESEAEDKNVDAFVYDEINLEYSEGDLKYISDLNFSQEKVLLKINSSDSLVIQGPPGTGKSQTITNLISHFIADGKKVLMVSEKKAALDVIYSRLGKISDYSLFIDDSNNKEDFYNQMSKMLKMFGSPSIILNEEESGILKIDENIKKLEYIAETLFTDSELGIQVNDVYNYAYKFDYEDEKTYELVEYLKDNIDDELCKLDFKTLTKIKEKFSDNSNLKKLVEFLRERRKYSWFEKVKYNLSDFEIKKIIKKINEVNDRLIAKKEMNFISRLSETSKIKKTISKVTAEILIDESKKYKFEKNFYRNPEVIAEFFKKFDNNKKLENRYKKFDDNELLWINCIYEVIKEKNISEIGLINEFIYNYILVAYLNTFEKKNPEVNEYINEFEYIVREISKNVKNKQKATASLVQSKLQTKIKNLENNRSFKEMSRRVEQKRKWSVQKFLTKFKFEIFNSIDIWLMTPDVVSEILPLENGLFDLVIFDEASQMYVERGLPALYRGKKIVIAGDDKQLRPSSLGFGRMNEEDEEESDGDAALEERSLLDLAKYKFNNTTLNYHYRSKFEELINFSNYAFYNASLYVSPNSAIPEEPPIKFISIDNGLWVNRSNLAEAEKTVELLKNILLEKENETVGVITFNSSQRDLVEDLIEKEKMNDPEFSLRVTKEKSREINGENIGLFIKNIENVQGDERDIIIFSIGYAINSQGKFIRNFGWLNQDGGENRLNVAITRAKEKVYIINSFDPDEFNVVGMKNKGPKILKEYLRYAKAISNGELEMSKQILFDLLDEKKDAHEVRFDSPFEEEVYNKLCEGGFDVVSQVGVGGYSIDLAIKNEKGEYLLGIECDGKLYHGSKSARERDYHRQKYLESRGWKIHRIWSPDWWTNSKYEIEKIASIINDTK